MFEIITTKGEVYDKCENMEELYDNFYYPLLVEYKELKKKYENAAADYETTMFEKVQLKAQQKEFIKYLEDEINICDGFLDTIKSDLEKVSYGGRLSNKTYIATQIMKNETGKKVYKEILQKYNRSIR